MADIIIKKGPIPGNVIPKLYAKLEGSKAPEMKGVTLIKPKIKVGYINFNSADSLKLMKLN